MDNSRIHKSIKFIIIVVIIIVSFLHLLRLINDSDFFWHLKTGEWIWQNKTLPSEDPFAYTTPQTHSSREHFFLTSYWLSQVLYYLVYFAGGMHTIVLLRFIVVGILIYVMTRRREGDALLYLAIFLIFITLILELYPIDRPQVFSFLFFAILLYLLEKIKNNTKIKAEVKINGIKNFNLNLFFLPLLMLIWANIHGGYILGQASIMLYVMMEGIKFIHPALKPIKREAYKGLLISGVCGIVFSFINPSIYQAWIEVINISEITPYVTEYLSTSQAFRMFHDYSIILYWFVLFLTVGGLVINIKRTDITEITLLSGIGVLSFMQGRYIAFFMIAALPVVGRFFSERRLVKFSRIVMIVISLFTAIFFTWNEQINFKNLTLGRWVNSRIFPVAAADFIVANGIKGNMYNYYNWGGYLMWRLAPERKVFVDGRVLYKQVVAQSIFIDNAYAKNIGGIPMWKAILEAYGVNYIIIPFSQPNGEIVPLTDALLKDSDWVPIFFQLNSMIFIKNIPENYDAIRKNTIPKDYFIKNLP